ncbi:MAG: chemotaxis protein CheX [Alkalispirochaeta sp.]
MKAEHANIFVRSAVHVFKKELGIKLTRDSLVRKDKPVPGLPVCIVLGITGNIRGQVVYAVDQSFAMEIAHQMVPNKLPLELKKLVNSAVGEIGNMITGQATIALAGKEQTLQITPPAVFTGREIQVDFLHMPTISMRMLSHAGVLEINIALTEEE